MVGDDVTVTVLGVKGNQSAHRHQRTENVSVHREEIYQHPAGKTRRWR